MSSPMKVFAGGVLRVTVHYVYYPVTEEVLRQVFEAYGVVHISVFQRADHVEAEVQLRSRNGAAQALALHGRCIYERSCLLDIQDVSPVASSSKSDMGELWDQIRDQLRELSEMMRATSWSTTPSSRETTSEESALDHDKILVDVSPEVTAPMVYGADQGVISIDPSSLAASTPTTCSMQCLSSDATVEVFPKLAALVESNEDLDTVSVTALTPATCSTGGLAHGRDSDNLVTASLVLSTMTPSSNALEEATPPSTHRPFSLFELDNMALTRRLTRCFNDEIGMLTPAFKLDVTPSMKQRGQMLRPSPCPSFVAKQPSTACSGMTELPLSAAIALRRDVIPYLTMPPLPFTLEVFLAFSSGSRHTGPAGHREASPYWWSVSRVVTTLEMIIEDIHREKLCLGELIFWPQPNSETVIPQPLSQAGEISDNKPSFGTIIMYQWFVYKESSEVPLTTPVTKVLQFLRNLSDSSVQTAIFSVDRHSTGIPMQALGVISASELFWSEAAPSSLVRDSLEGGHQLNYVWRAQRVSCCVLETHIEEEKGFHICAAAHQDMRLCLSDMEPVNPIYTSMFNQRFGARGNRLKLRHIGTIDAQSNISSVGIVNHLIYHIEHLLVGSRVPWHLRVFRLDIGQSTLLKLNEHKLVWVDLQVVNKLTAVILQWFSFMVLLQITRLAIGEWDPGIVSMALLLSTLRTVSTQGLIVPTVRCSLGHEPELPAATPWDPGIFMNLICRATLQITDTLLGASPVNGVHDYLDYNVADMIATGWRASSDKQMFDPMNIWTSFELPCETHHGLELMLLSGNQQNLAFECYFLGQDSADDPSVSATVAIEYWSPIIVLPVETPWDPGGSAIR